MNNKFEICIIGVGYVGLVTAVCFAELGNTVWCIDSDCKKIGELNQGIVPFYEPGLEDMLAKNINSNRIRFTTDLGTGVESSFIIFIAVGTPANCDGSVDVCNVLDVAKGIAGHIDEYKVVVIKSTVPVGTAEEIKQILSSENKGFKTKFDIASNPEFLREGSAIEDFMRPERIIIGIESAEAAQVLTELYETVNPDGQALLIMDIKSAEMTKYTANAMLATRISFMNEMSNLCEAADADIEKVRIGIGTDKRIGPLFLNAGVGYGGSCLPKDIKGLINIGHKYKLEMHILNSVDHVNTIQMQYFLQKIFNRFGNELSGCRFAVWGLAFKPRTDDIRESPALSIITEIIEKGGEVNAYDPFALNNAKGILNRDEVYYFDDMYCSLKNVDALIIVTEWEQFRLADFTAMEKLMKNRVIFDGRNIYDTCKMKNFGFEYYCVGRN